MGRRLRTVSGVVFAGLLVVARRPGRRAIRPTRRPEDDRAPGFEVSLVAAEPLVRQPVAIDFDDRGRLWVMQYLQYPNPAGLKRVKVDRYSRTVYDRVPEPPPRGPKGADRITILLTDTDGTAARKAQGLRHRAEPRQRLRLRPRRRLRPAGAVPALLPRPRRRRRARRRPRRAAHRLRHGGRPLRRQLADLGAGRLALRLPGQHGHGQRPRHRVPAGRLALPPAHARSSSCSARAAATPGASTSTATATCSPAPTTAASSMLHGVQGGYYWKSFGKHGPLHNPYAYGYFDHVPHARLHAAATSPSAASSTAATRSRPASAAATSPPTCSATPSTGTTSSRTARRSARGTAASCCVANDTWFAPSDVGLGPDGAVYVADWHDRAHRPPRPRRRVGPQQRPHLPHRGDGDASRSATGRPGASCRATSWSSCCRTRTTGSSARPRRILADRRDPEVIFPLRTLVLESEGRAARAAGAVGAVRQRRVRRGVRRRAARPPQPARPPLGRALARRRAEGRRPRLAVGSSTLRGRGAERRSSAASSPARRSGCRRPTALPIVERSDRATRRATTRTSRCCCGGRSSGTRSTAPDAIVSSLRLAEALAIGLADGASCRAWSAATPPRATGPGDARLHPAARPSAPTARALRGCSSALD